MSDQTVSLIELPAQARRELAAAVTRLEGGHGLIVRLADLGTGAIGRSMRLGMQRFAAVPDLERKTLALVQAALRRAFDVAVLGMDRNRPAPSRVNSAVVMLSGAVGGFLGLSGLLPDIAVTTAVIMRSIARAAQEQGEDLSDEDARRACLQVLALGGDGHSDLTYVSARMVMQGRPIVLLMTEVATRYGITLSQKLALQAVPVIGAATGAALNAAFLQHYRDLARAHFTVRRLERLYGVGPVERAWPASSAASST